MIIKSSKKASCAACVVGITNLLAPTDAQAKHVISIIDNDSESSYVVVCHNDVFAIPSIVTQQKGTTPIEIGHG